MTFIARIKTIGEKMRGRAFVCAPLAFSVVFILTLILAPETAHAQADIGTKFLSYLMAPFVSFFALLVYAGGVALNASAYFSIVQMGNLVNGSSGLAIAWDLFRDLGNIVIVFGFIAVGIATILDVGKYNAKKMLATLLIVAVVMNFSSLIARGVIDVGNVIGLQFYKAINGNELPSGNVFGGGISDQFMQAVGLQGIYDADALYKTYGANLADHYFTFALLIIILFTVTAFVFFSIAFLFVARFVILALLITVSPLAFAAMAIPKFNSMTGKWWDLLIKNTLVAPAVLLMLLVSLKIVQDPNFLKMTQGAAWVDTGAASWAYLVLAFGIVCGFFLASLLVAKQFSAFGANFATSLGGKLAFGATGFAARQTLGRAGTGMSRAFRRTALGQTEAGRYLAGGLDKVGTASFDMRNTIKSVSGVDAGKGQKGGRDADEKATKKAQIAYAKTLTQSSEQELTERAIKQRKKEEEESLENKKTSVNARYAEQINPEKNRAAAQRDVLNKKTTAHAQATQAEQEAQKKLTEADEAVRQKPNDALAIANRQRASTALEKAKASSAESQASMTLAKNNLDQTLEKIKELEEKRDSEIQTFEKATEDELKFLDRELEKTNPQFQYANSVERDTLARGVGAAVKVGVGAAVGGLPGAVVGGVIAHRAIEKENARITDKTTVKAQKSLAALTASAIRKDAGMNDAERTQKALLDALEKNSSSSEKKDS